MEDKDKLDVTNTFVPYDNLRSRTRLLKSLFALLTRETDDPENSGETTEMKATPAASWTRRLASWFGRS